MFLIIEMCLEVKTFAIILCMETVRDKKKKFGCWMEIVTLPIK